MSTLTAAEMRVFNNGGIVLVGRATRGPTGWGLMVRRDVMPDSITSMYSVVDKKGKDRAWQTLDALYKFACDHGVHNIDIEVDTSRNFRLTERRGGLISEA